MGLKRGFYGVFYVFENKAVLSRDPRGGWGHSGSTITSRYRDQQDARLLWTLQLEWQPRRVYLKRQPRSDPD